MDFTIQKYDELLQMLHQNKVKVYSVEKWLKKPGVNGVIIRHDVDRKPANSLEIAKLEARYQMVATYYFRITSNSFDPQIITAIKNLGHEIGFHYEELAVHKGDYKKAISSFKEHLKKLRTVAPVTTIAMHGRPLSPYDSRDLWQHYDYRQFDLIGEAFLSINYDDIFYFTDTGRSWSNTSSNIRDKVESKMQTNVKNTDDLIHFIHKNTDKKIAIVAHPERWALTRTEYFFVLIKDLITNLIKQVIKLIR